MNLEQQLTEAIAAQNALTQAVANWKERIDASVAALKTQAEAAMQATRVYTDGGVTRANSLVQYKNTSELSSANTGMFLIKTPALMTSDCMGVYKIHGHDYGAWQVIDMTIATYLYQNQPAPNGALGWFYATTAVRGGNWTKNKIWLGEDPANGKMVIAIGLPMASNYYVQFVVDAVWTVNPPSTNPADWSVAINKSAAPAAGATTGFGLINLLSI